MAEKKKVYVETSVISNLAARPSVNMIDAAHQLVTRQWWEGDRSQYDLYVSELVVEEAQRGDAEAAAKRMSVLSGLPVLVITNDMRKLAACLLEMTAVPPKSYEDAVHIAVATVNRMDYLLTWNCRHIANASTMPKIIATCEALNLKCPIICTPEQMKGGS